VSPATGRPYPVTMVCEAFRVARSTFYASGGASRDGASAKAPGKRGPKTTIGDDELVEKIRQTINGSPFYGEGYRKVHARMRLRVGRNRVLRLMCEHGLLAPTRRVHARATTEPLRLRSPTGCGGPTPRASGRTRRGCAGSSWP
jgi:hypothetical protein